VSAVAKLLQPRTGGLLVLAAILLLLPLLLPNRYYFDVAILVGINALVVVGLNLLIGYAGQISLGHAGFFGLGAYASAVLPAQYGVPPFAALLLGAVGVGLLAFVIGRPILRLRGHYLAVATLGMGLLIYMVLSNELDLTGGPDGMAVQRLSVFGVKLRGAQTWYWIVAGVLFAGTWLAFNLIDSPTGRALRALHDSEVAAQVNGVDVARYKLTAFVVSAVFASLAGSLNAHYSGFITPQAAGFLHSIGLVTMVVLGGMGSTFGGIIGAAVLTVLPQLLTVFHDYEHALLGLIMMACMIFLRDGLLPSLQQILQQRLRWRSP
jgi:branched-chain amino acid transport system permease protein